jgi:type II restriction enzyme
MNKFIKNSKDLETTYAAKLSGFLEIALRKNREALPYIDEARALKAIASTYKTPRDLAKDKRIFVPLSEAAGISTKASNYLESSDIEGIIKEFIENFLEASGENFVDELIYRFLLTKGDALGGRMRNIVGALASEKVTRYLLASLRNQKISHSLLLNKESEWKNSNSITQDDLISVKALRWERSKGIEREIVYNIKVPIVNKNIDISVFNKQTTSITTPALMKQFVSNPKNYLALGELKGGIDPAGADEHWKTANTALQRIRNSFSASSCDVKTFFVGGAIEVSMAEEIFNQVKNRELSTAANLTNVNQLTEICSWLINL